MRRNTIIALLFVVLCPVVSFAAATVAYRAQGIFFPSRSATPFPTAQSVGFYNLNGALEKCLGSDGGTCYAQTLQIPDAGTSADAGTALGTAAAAKIDTCETGSNGTHCYRLKDVVTALKSIGALSP